MEDSLTRCRKQLVFPIAAAVFFGTLGSAFAQSNVARDRAADPSAVVRGTSNGDRALQKVETERASNTRPNGRTAIGRSRKTTTATGAATVSAAPVALALEDAGPGPSSTPEPLSILLVGGALAGLYRMRRHIS
jgi:hypothetical protein